MSLNMYMYRVHKIPQKELNLFKGKTRKQIEDLIPDKWYDVLYIDEEIVKNMPYLYKELMPYLSPLTIQQTYIDDYKIKRDNNIPFSAKMDCSKYEDGEESIDGLSLIFNYILSNGERTFVEISKKEVEKKYTMKRTEKKYVVYIGKIAHWTDGSWYKYDIRNLVYDHIKDMKPYVFYKISEKLMRAIQEIEVGLSYCSYTNTTREATFYYEELC